MNRIFDFIMNADEEGKAMLSNDINTLILDVYYYRYWNENTWSYERSGANLALEVNQLRGESVLDVGCGDNLFKDRIYDLYGIDVFNSNADKQISHVQYQAENPDKQFDVVLALDSINSGRKQDIIHQFEALDKLTKSGGHQFWRVNQNRPNSGGFPLLDLIEFFEWDEKFIRELAECYGYQVKELCEETNLDGEKRLFFCFYKY